MAWSTWISSDIVDEPESGGGLMVAAIQLAIMLGAGLGGVLFDRFSAVAAFMGGAFLLLCAGLAVGNGKRLQPSGNH